MRRGASAAILAAIGLGLVALTLASPGPAAAIDPRAAATELVALTNISRTSNGLPALPRDRRLGSVAVSRSEDMIARNYFAHTIPPDGRTVNDVLESLGVLFRAAGENIEFNAALDFMTVQYASNDFMNSPSHRQNVLNSRWDRLGAGVAEGGGKRMYTVLFTQSPTDPAPAPQPRPGQTPPGPGPGAPAVPRDRGERIEVVVAPTGLVDSLINRTLRLYLNL